MIWAATSQTGGLFYLFWMDIFREVLITSFLLTPEFLQLILALT